MARIAGVELPDEKKAEIGLTTIFGVGRKLAYSLLMGADIKPTKKIKELTTEEITKLQKAVDQLQVEGTLRQKVTDDVKRLATMGSYRGLRHSQNLPSRGQRTRSNARTKRGRRQTVGALKKKDMSRQSGPGGEAKE